MANLRNESGAIVINSAEAEADMRNLRNARTALENAKTRLRAEKTRLDSTWEGNAKIAFDNKYNEVIRRIDATVTAISASIKAIADTVAHYERIERNLVALMRAEAAIENNKGGKKI
jgi:uncharacterized protein YukE